jgi:hypothetical protein
MNAAIAPLMTAVNHRCMGSVIIVPRMFISSALNVFFSKLPTSLRQVDEL